MSKPKLSCYDAALKMLSLRGYAVKELCGALKKKDYEGYDIAQTIERLEEDNFLNDEKFAENRVRYRAEISKWGTRRIQQELVQKGVAENTVTRALLDLTTPEDARWQQPHDFKETALSLLNRRFGKWPEHLEELADDFESQQQQRKQQEKEMSKRMNFLLRRGFELAEARDAFEKNKAGIEER